MKTKFSFLMGSFLSVVAVFLLAGCSEDPVNVSGQVQDIPLVFEENMGQVEGDVKYMMRNGSGAVYFSPNEVAYKMLGDRENEMKGYIFRQNFLNANKNPKMTADDIREGTVNYFIGEDESKWKKEVATFGKIKYEELYKGIDLEYLAAESALKYEYLVSPGADYKQIRVKLGGIDSLEIDVDGNLIMKNKFKNVMLEKPYTYQIINGKKQEVVSGYELLSSDTYSFNVSSYDETLPLIIDPRIVYSTYFGEAAAYQILGLKRDASGNLYITGNANAAGLPGVTGFYDPTHNGGNDVFVTKLNPTVSGVIYSTYIGGTGTDSVKGLEVNISGEAYVAGYSLSFPVTAGAYDETANGVEDGFVARLSADGTQLLSSTYFGGTDRDEINAISMDSSGNIYFAGWTFSSESESFPLVSSYDNTYGGTVFTSTNDGFFAKMNSTLTTLTYSSYLGGSTGEAIHGIFADSSGNIYLTGNTNSTDFPVLNQYQTSNAGGDGTDTFITKINSDGTTLMYSSYLGGAGNDYFTAIDGDDSGLVVMTGYSYYTFPLKSAIESYDFTPSAGRYTGIYSKFNTTLSGASSLTYSGYMGGIGYTRTNGVVLDASGNAYFTGSSTSAGTVPYQTTADAVQPSPSHAQHVNTTPTDMVLTKLGPTGTHLYSTYYGVNSVSEYGFGIDVDSSGFVYVGGSANGAGMPTTSGVIQPTYTSGGLSNGYIYKMATVNEAPTAPTVLYSNNTSAASGQTNPTGLTDTTPAFSAICNDPDVNEIMNKYQIQIDTDAGFSPVYWESSALGVAMSNCGVGNRSASVSYNGTPLALDGTTYYWRIKFWDDSASAGVFSDSATFSMATITAPGQVTGLAAEPGAGQVVLTWLAPASDGGSPITNYKVNYAKTSAFVNDNPTPILTLGDVLTTTITGLDNGFEYTFEVRAVNAIGAGAYSSEVTSTPAVPPSGGSVEGDVNIDITNSITLDIVGPNPFGIAGVPLDPQSGTTTTLVRAGDAIANPDGTVSTFTMKTNNSVGGSITVSGSVTNGGELKSASATILNSGAGSSLSASCLAAESNTSYTGLSIRPIVSESDVSFVYDAVTSLADKFGLDTSVSSRLWCHATGAALTLAKTVGFNNPDTGTILKIDYLLGVIAGSSVPAGSYSETLTFTAIAN